MKVLVFDSYDEMSVAAADIIADVVKNKPDGVLGLATGSTPVGMYNRSDFESDKEYEDFEKTCEKCRYHE